MIRILLAILLITACARPALADDITIINRPALAETIYTMPSDTCDRLPNQPAPNQSSHTYMLPGAAWSITLVPINFDDDLTGREFRAEFVPAKPLIVILDAISTVTDYYADGVVFTTWSDVVTYHGTPYGIAPDQPINIQQATLIESVGDANDGYNTWIISWSFPFNTTGTSQALPIPVDVTLSADTPPRVRIAIGGEQTRVMSSVPGQLLLTVSDPGAMYPSLLYRLPLEFYPTVTRQP